MDVPIHMDNNNHDSNLSKLLFIENSYDLYYKVHKQQIAIKYTNLYIRYRLPCTERNRITMHRRCRHPKILIQTKKSRIGSISES